MYASSAKGPRQARAGADLFRFLYSCTRRLRHRLPELIVFAAPTEIQPWINLAASMLLRHLFINRRLRHKVRSGRQFAASLTPSHRHARRRLHRGTVILVPSNSRNSSGRPIATAPN